MASSPAQPTLDFYRRDGCEPCDEARLALQLVLEDRVRRGDRIARVRYRDVAESAALEALYGDRVPVLALDGEELALTVTERSIQRFLDRVLGRSA
jgi:hypothetical protein